MAGDDIDAERHPSTQAAIRDLIVLERFVIDDGETEALWDGDQEYADILVINEDTDETGKFITKGSGNAVNQYDGETEWGASTGAQDNNLFHDGSDYVVENNAAGSNQSYTVVGFREV